MKRLIEFLLIMTFCAGLFVSFAWAEDARKSPDVTEEQELKFKKNLKKWEKLTDLTETVIRYIIDILEIKTKIIRCSDFILNSCGTDLIIDVCKKVGSDTFLSGKHGKDYLDEKKFRQNNIKLIYQNFKHPHYRQLYGPFMENMSVIDLLFNEGEKSIKIVSEITKDK